MEWVPLLGPLLVILVLLASFFIRQSKVRTRFFLQSFCA
jgi:hypothetical protein